MERNEIIEILRAKANVNREEAIEALEKSNWDVLDAILYLERKGSIRNSKVTTIIEVQAKNERQDENKEEKFGGIGEIIGRLFKFAGKVLKKAQSSHLEIRKENKKPIRISLLISGILSIFLFVPSIILLILGVFCGYKYSISGIGDSEKDVNDIFDEISKSASNIKRDFKEGYGK